VLLLVLMYFIVYFMYKLSEPKGGERVARVPGAIAASALLVAVSALFSWLISTSVRITVVYGSLASVIIMMLWLYLCGIILIMGNALNVVIHRFRHTGMYYVSGK
jgi:membrane protein